MERRVARLPEDQIYAGDSTGVTLDLRLFQPASCVTTAGVSDPELRDAVTVGSSPILTQMARAGPAPCWSRSSSLAP